jgi:hypothetical protein
VNLEWYRLGRAVFHYSVPAFGISSLGGKQGENVATRLSPIVSFMDSVLHCHSPWIAGVQSAKGVTTYGSVFTVRSLWEKDGIEEWTLFSQSTW